MSFVQTKQNQDGKHIGTTSPNNLYRIEQNKWDILRKTRMMRVSVSENF